MLAEKMPLRVRERESKTMKGDEVFKGEQRDQEIDRKERKRASHFEIKRGREDFTLILCLIIFVS